VFRNPSGQFAAQLIEAAGLKGTEHGDAVVSDKHANFILNRGAATAADVEALIEEVRERVVEHSGAELQLEVRIIGESQVRSGE
ncbi:MAG: UDP-N-acetylmuramate dehydrogenase, partial [Gammaproteobacteria bacterium]